MIDLDDLNEEEREMLMQYLQQEYEKNPDAFPFPQELLESVPQARTVPQIFLYGQYIGGFDKLAEYFESHGMWEN